MNLHLVTAYFVPVNRSTDDRMMKVVVDMEKFIAAFPEKGGCIELLFVNHCRLTVRRCDYVALMKELGVDGNKFMPEVSNTWNSV